MSTDIGVSSEGQEQFRELRNGQKKDIIYQLNDTYTEVIVDKSGSGNDYDEFLGQLPESEPRFAVYDFGKKKCWVSWAPDASKARAKMTYASVNNSIRQRLGVPYHEIFAVHVDDLDYESVCAKIRVSV